MSDKTAIAGDTEAQEKAEVQEVSSKLHDFVIGNKDHIEEILKSQDQEDSFGLADAEIRRQAHSLNRSTKKIYDIFMNDGFEDPQTRNFCLQKGEADYKQHRITLNNMIEKMEDAQHTSNKSLFLPKVITKIVRDAIEPETVLEPLFRKMRYNGETINFPAFGGMVAADIGAAEEYPEQKLEAAGQISINIGKSGLAVMMTDEMIRYSQYDLMRISIEHAAKALIRHKEVKCANHLSDNSTAIFNNQGRFGLDGAPVAGTYSTSGRGSDGATNGTFTINDLFIMYAESVKRGFVPNTLVMNPMGWLIFAMSPELRAFGFNNNGQMFQALSGQVGRARQWEKGPNVWASTGNNELLGSTYAEVPNMFPSTLNIVVSPFVYHAQDGSTDEFKTHIHMADRAEIGLIVVDEEPVTEEWSDPRRDIKKTKIRERYGIGSLHNNEAIISAKNIIIKKGYDIEDKIMWDAQSGGLAAGPEDHPWMS